MKAVLLIFALAVFAVSESSIIRATSRSNLNVGYVRPGDRLLHRNYYYQPPRAGTVQYQDVAYRGNATTRISAVQANEVGQTQYASAYIIGGGVGFSNVTVRFTSYPGYGYYYLLDIWGL